MRWKALLSLMVVAVVALSPHAGAAALTGDDSGNDAAPMAILSSFTADTQGAAIIGGTRTITVHNFAATGIRASVDLDPAPCDCTMSLIVASHGKVSGTIWTIEGLPGGHTATLTISYGSESSEPVAIKAHSTAPASAEDSAPGDVPAHTIVRSRHIAL